MFMGLGDSTGCLQEPRRRVQCASRGQEGKKQGQRAPMGLGDSTGCLQEPRRRVQCASRGQNGPKWTVQLPPWVVEVTRTGGV